LLTGCTIVQPVPESAQGGRLSSRLSDATARAADPAASAAAAKECDGPSAYAGRLDLAICDADARRLSYVRRSADVLNQTATYNALLWPLGAAGLYEKLRGAANSSLLLPAAVAAGAYGFISSGVPDRQRNYLAAARQLSCAIVASGVDLYATGEVDSDAHDRHALRLASPMPLAAAVSDLRLQIGQYEQGRADVLAQLKPRPGSAAQASTNFFDAAALRHNGGGGGSQRSDSRALVRGETRARLNHAYAELGRAQALLRRLSSGAASRALRAEAARVDAELQERLALKAAPPADPASVAVSLLATQRSLLQLQAGRDTQTPTVDVLEPALPPEAYDGLDAGSADKLRGFQRQHAALLRAAQAEVADWLARHEAGRRDVDIALVQAGCTTTANTNAAADPSKMIDVTASGTRNRPATSAGAAGSARTGAASGTPLDPP